MSRPFRFTLACIAILLFVVGIGAISLRSAINKPSRIFRLGGINLTYDSVRISWIQGSAEVHGLTLQKTPHDSACAEPESIKAKRVRVGGIGWVRLLLNRRLAIERLNIDSLDLLLRDGRIFASDSTEQRTDEFALVINEIDIVGARYMQVDRDDCHIITELESNVTARELELELYPHRAPSYRIAQLGISGMQMMLPQAHYKVTIPSAAVVWQDSTLTVDTLRIVPLLSKAAHGHAYGYEVDRFDVTVPFLRARGLRFSSPDSLFADVGVIDVQFYLKIFRDKNLPFRPRKKPLPLDAIRKLAFPLHVDTLRVIHSYAEYEELPEQADEAGRVYFDNLYALFHNIDNRATSGATGLSATSNLSGHGELRLDVNIPLADGKDAVARGGITNFNLPKINTMLTPSTNLMIESGDMKEMSFAFSFDQVHSSGEMQFNYRDLKLVRFKDVQDGQSDSIKDNFKTFILNTFVFRKHMDDDVPEEKRTGAIAYRRDTARSVFNYWVKSLISGLKSAYNLPGSSGEVSETQQQLNGQERLARNMHRVAKRKEREDQR